MDVAILLAFGLAFGGNGTAAFATAKKLHEDFGFCISSASNVSMYDMEVSFLIGLLMFDLCAWRSEPPALLTHGRAADV